MIRLLSLSAMSAMMAAACASGPSPDDSQQRPSNQKPFDDPMQWIAIGTDTLDRLKADRPDGVDFDPVVVNGDVAVIPLTPDKAIEISKTIHELTHRCGGFTSHASYEEAVAASTAASTPSLFAPEDLVIDNGEVASMLIDGTDELNILTTIEALSSFHTRLHSSTTGAEAPVWIRDLWQGMIGERTDVTVELVNHDSTPQQSVMMTITGATLPDEVVVLGAHLDSIAFGGQNPRSPGADDDASGVATISEIARVMLASDFRPARTIHIIAMRLKRLDFAVRVKSHNRLLMPEPTLSRSFSST